MSRRRTEHDERERLRLVDRDRIVGRREDAVKAALCAGIVPQDLRDGGVDLVRRQSLGPIVREPVQRRLGGEPIAAGFLNVFLMAQAMMYESVTGETSTPWSVKSSPWPVYDLFETRAGESIFLSIVGEEQWEGFCRAFGFEGWLADPRLATGQGRVDNRHWIIPAIADTLRQRDMAALCDAFEHLGLPFAPVNKPGDLFHDPHLNASGGLLDITLADGRQVKTPALPFLINGERLQKRRDPPKLGEHTHEVLAELDQMKAT